MLRLKLMFIIHSPWVDGTVVIAGSVAFTQNKMMPFFRHAQRSVRHLSTIGK